VVHRIDFVDSFDPVRLVVEGGVQAPKGRRREAEPVVEGAVDAIDRLPKMVDWVLGSSTRGGAIRLGSGGAAGDARWDRDGG